MGLFPFSKTDIKTGDAIVSEPSSQATQEIISDCRTPKSPPRLGASIPKDYVAMNTILSTLATIMIYDYHGEKANCHWYERYEILNLIYIF